MIELSTYGLIAVPALSSGHTAVAQGRNLQRPAFIFSYWNVPCWFDLSMIYPMLTSHLPQVSWDDCMVISRIAGNSIHFLHIQLPTDRIIEIQRVLLECAFWSSMFKDFYNRFPYVSISKKKSSMD